MKNREEEGTLPDQTDCEGGRRFTPACGAAECGSASIAAGAATAMCRCEATGASPEVRSGRVPSSSRPEYHIPARPSKDKKMYTRPILWYNIKPRFIFSLSRPIRRDKNGRYLSHHENRDEA